MGGGWGRGSIIFFGTLWIVKIGGREILFLSLWTSVEIGGEGGGGGGGLIRPVPSLERAEKWRELENQ